MENNQLRGLIREKYKTDAAFGFAIGWTTQKVSKLLNSTYTPKIGEAARISRALGISLDELASFFVQ